MSKCECFKIMRIGQSAAKPRTEEGSTTRVEILVGRSLPKWEKPKLDGEYLFSRVKWYGLLFYESKRKLLTY